ncbi:MAG: hypothetical protein Q6354_06615 [Candidatus Brocadiales bacterium]|nr:hypothetical protein [Candidatus Brocadiales bacterium]
MFLDEIWFILQSFYITFKIPEPTAHSKESFLEDEGVQFSLKEGPVVLREKGWASDKNIGKLS